MNKIDYSKMRTIEEILDEMLDEQTQTKHLQ